MCLFKFSISNTIVLCNDNNKYNLLNTLDIKIKITIDILLNY